MSRLIDADKIRIEDFYDCVDMYECMEVINQQPTIHPQGIDKDRLIEEITKIADRYCDSIKCEMPCIEDETYICDYANMIGAILDFINQQSTTDGWIPVSERLPKPYEEVIFCNNIISCYGSIDSDGVWWASDVIPFKQFMKAYNVKAWRPLPQPYKESE